MNIISRGERMETKIGLLVLMVMFLNADEVEYVGGVGLPYGSGRCVYVKDNYAYVGQWERFTIVDVSFPQVPKVISSTYGSLFEAVGIHVKDTLAYLNKSGAFFSIVNVSNPSSPKPMGWTLVQGGVDKKDISHGCLIILPCYSPGIAIINVDDPTNPFVVSYYDTPGFAIDLFEKDSLVYVADYTSLQIIDIHDPEHPVGLGSLPMPEDRVGYILYCYDVFVVDTFAFVAAEPAEYEVYGNLFIISVADPKNPYYIDTVKVKGSPWCVYCAGDFAYVGAKEAWAPEEEDTISVPGGLRVVNKRKIEDAGVTSSLDMSWVRDVFVKDSLVYVVTEDSLLIFKHVYTGIEESIWYAGTRGISMGGEWQRGYIL